MRVFPAYCEKSTITSALSAAAIRSACLSAFPKSNLVGSVTQVIGWFGTTTGAGRNPPSVPIWMNDGPRVAGSGTPPSLPSVGQLAGKPEVAMAGTILTSVLFLPSADVTFVSATYNCRLTKRSSAAFRTRNRYAFGSTVRLGYAAPLTIAVSM